MSPILTADTDAATTLTFNNECSDMGVQMLYIVRHGDRWDYENPKWTETTDRPGDPPLSDLGHAQARETGIFLDQLFSNDGVTGDDVTWLSSPFLRTLQTSNEAISQLQKVPGAANIKILPESSIFEWDGKNGAWHASLPPIAERSHYFPRLDITHESLFVPNIPEPRIVFHDRCDRAIQLLNGNYPVTPQRRKVIVMVSHAAACISLVRAATNMSLADVTPAAPCSVYKLTRRAHDTSWTIDAHDTANSMNGYTAHLTNMGTNTVPWNHFGDKLIHQGYTGPKASRFAPTSIASD
ncbi:hypothetical protein MPSEU_000650900 [Mayamaea pseudoterrestris]|nr:hypothetical protein MPSEU_000650900 [Mayamaea pseudoterrestris]